MQIGISRRDSGVRRNGKFFFPDFQLLPFRCKSESPRDLSAFAGMSKFGVYSAPRFPILRRDSGVRRNGKFFFPNFQLLPFRCKSESPAEIPAFAGMVNPFFLISNFYHSDVNRNLPPPSDSCRRIPASPPSFPRKRESIFADKFPRSRRFLRKKCAEIPNLIFA